MNKIISQITQTINSFVTDMLTTLQSQTPEWETDIKGRLDSFIINLISGQLQMLDDEFFHSPDRLKHYLSKDTVQRTVTTTLGVITFQRRKYKRRDGKGYYYHIDELLHLDRYERITKEVKAELLRLISTEQLSYQKAARNFNLSKTVVCSLLRALELEDAAPELEKRIACDYLHVIADEDHIALQEHRTERKSRECPKTNSYMIKHVTLFTGIRKVSKHRNALENRIILTPFAGESSEGFYERVNHFIYDNFSVRHKIYAYGDGATWIKALADEISAPFILDKFHMQQSLVRIAGGKKNKELLSELRKLLEANKKKEFFKIVDEHYEGTEISQFKQDQIAYIRRQWTNYQRNFTIPKAQYCCAEGINSHYFSSRLSSRPKGFSRTNAHNLAFLLTQAASHHKLTKGIKQFLPKPKVEKQNLRTGNRYYNPVQMPVIQFGKTSWEYKRLRSLTSSNI